MVNRFMGSPSGGAAECWPSRSRSKSVSSVCDVVTAPRFNVATSSRFAPDFASRPHYLKDLFLPSSMTLVRISYHVVTLPASGVERDDVENVVTSKRGDVGTWVRAMKTIAFVNSKGGTLHGLHRQAGPPVVLPKPSR